MLAAFILLLAIGGVVAIITAGSAVNGWLFDRYVRRELGRDLSGPHPPATIFLPCKGVDKLLRETLAAVRNQKYDDYDIVCAVESEDDPACALIREAAARPEGAPLRLVVAGHHAASCSQKITNLLAGIATVRPQTRVYTFIDSDAVPHRDWLRAMVAPLNDTNVGAVTGFRWYVPGDTWVGVFRCAWNAVGLTLLGGHARNFCWGGSIVMKRALFDELRIGERWQRVLSEDFEITRAVLEAGRYIHFTPQALIPNDDHAAWVPFLRFARRQLIICRVCHPPFWIAGATYTLLYATAFWGLLLFAGYYFFAGQSRFSIWALALVLTIYFLSAIKGVLRQRAVARMLPDVSLRRGGMLIDILGGPLTLLLNVALCFASGISNRFWWRDTLYDMCGVENVKILGRRTAANEALD